MSIWAYGTITNKGNALQAKLTGGDDLIFTRFMAGTGTAPVGQLANQTSVTDEIASLTAQDFSYRDNSVTIPLLLENTGVTTEYTAKQIGMYATDPDEGEILYAIVQDSTGERVPTAADNPGFSIEFRFTVGYGGASTVDITIDPAGLVTYSGGDNRYAPTDHSSSNPGYGAGSNTNYGHLKLSDVTNSTSGVGDGTAATPSAVKAVKEMIHNFNHLQNWDFRNVVNFDGRTTYTFSNTSPKVIERWKALNGLVTAFIGSSKITLNSNTTTQGAWLIEQFVADASKFIGKEVTFSVSYMNKTGGNIQLLIIDGGGTAYGGQKAAAGGIVTITKTIAAGTSTLRCIIAKEVSTAAFTCDIYAAKLELGPESTIAEEPPVDFASQALICRSVDINGNYVGGTNTLALATI